VLAGVLDDDGCAGLDDVAAERVRERQLVQPVGQADRAEVDLPAGLDEREHRDLGAEQAGRRPGEAVEGVGARRAAEVGGGEGGEPRGVGEGDGGHAAPESRHADALLDCGSAAAGVPGEAADGEHDPQRGPQGEHPEGRPRDVRRDHRPERPVDEVRQRQHLRDVAQDGGGAPRRRRRRRRSTTTGRKTR
jgi:hypothetical protein